MARDWAKMEGRGVIAVIRMVDAGPRKKSREPRPAREHMRKMTWIAAAFAGLAALAVAAQAADDYPARPVRIVVGFGPGATIDVTARILAPKLGAAFNQQFVVENKTGAGSNLAADFVAHAPKDGYTLLVGTIANTILL